MVLFLLNIFKNIGGANKSLTTIESITIKKYNSEEVSRVHTKRLSVEMTGFSRLVTESENVI